MLICYQSSSKSAIENSLHRWTMRPKFHHIDECVRRAMRTHIRPACFGLGALKILAALSPGLHDGFADPQFIAGLWKDGLSSGGPT